MRFISLTKYFLYSVEKKCSEIQLKEDFGDFSPAPLHCKNRNLDFNLVKTRGAGDLCYCLIKIKNLLRAAAEDANLVSPELIRIAGIKKDYLFFKLLLISPVLFYALVKIIRNKKNALGLFLPLLKNDRQIGVGMGVNKENRSMEAVISHEHIHLLQHRSIEKHSRYIKHPEILISDKHKNDKALWYFLEKKETEARLHEIVLSYYRIKRELPLTIEGFMELLAGSNAFGFSVIEALTSRGISVKPDIIKYYLNP